MTDALDHVLKTVPDKIATFLKSQVLTIESHPNQDVSIALLPFTQNLP